MKKEESIREKVGIRDILKNGGALERSILKKHIFSLLSLLFLIIICFMLLRHLDTTNSDTAYMVNTIGKQRMNTQTILLEVERLQRGASSKKSVENILFEFSDSYYFLAEKFKDKSSILYNDTIIYNIFFGEYGLEEKVTYFIRFITTNSSEIETIETLGAEVLELYNQATYRAQKIGEKHHQTYSIYRYLLLFLIALTVLLEAYFIFRPTIIDAYIYQKRAKELNKSLEQRVAREIEKNREQEQLLIQRSKLAEMGEMLSNIAHQWRQPLTTLGLIIEVLTFIKTDNKQLEGELNNIHKEAQIQIDLMSKTINDFKDFYKPDRKRDNFNIKKAIKSVLEILRTNITHSNISIDVNIESENLEIFGFQNEYKQVLLNILQNSIENFQTETKEDEKRDKVIKISVKSSTDDLLVTIEDSGGGIDSSLLDKIFNPYFTTKEKSGGSGIGLYMSKTIIEKHFDGKIEAKNIKNGVSFTIITPIQTPYQYIE